MSSSLILDVVLMPYLTVVVHQPSGAATVYTAPTVNDAMSILRRLALPGEAFRQGSPVIKMDASGKVTYCVQEAAAQFARLARSV